MTGKLTFLRNIINNLQNFSC